MPHHTYRLIYVDIKRARHCRDASHLNHRNLAMGGKPSKLGKSVSAGEKRRNLASEKPSKLNKSALTEEKRQQARVYWPTFFAEFDAAVVAKATEMLNNKVHVTDNGKAQLQALTYREWLGPGGGCCARNHFKHCREACDVVRFALQKTLVKLSHDQV